MLSVREPGESILWQHGFARCPRAGQSIPVKKWNSLQGKQLHYKCFGGIKWLRQSSAPEFTKNTLRAFLHICCRQIVCNDVILKVNDGYYGVIYTAEVPVGFFFTVLSVQRDKTLKIYVMSVRKHTNLVQDKWPFNIFTLSTCCFPTSALAPWHTRTMWRRNQKAHKKRLPVSHTAENCNYSTAYWSY